MGTGARPRPSRRRRAVWRLRARALCFLATGRPVVVSRGLGDLDSMLSKFKAGIILNSERPDESVAELKTLLQDPATPLRCRELAEKYFSMERAVEEYVKILKGLID